MNIKNEQLIENKITISETDIVNGGEVMVLIAYAIKENDSMWSFPAPQIFNEELYLRNKAEYDKTVKEFRLNAEE